MAKVLIVGGGVAGLSTGMLLAKDGHEVVLVERDAAPPAPDPDGAWDGWERRGVNQFRMLHYFQPRFRQLLESELPDAVTALDADGALRFNAIALIPDEMKGGVRDGDDDFEALTGRRPMIEAALARVADAMPGLTVRRGVAVDGLLTGAEAIPGVPNVVGVRTEDGEDITADVVIDASGRRSPLPRWIEAIGARPPVEEVEDSGFVYYGRHFRSADGSLPAMIGPLLGHYGSVSILSLPADNGTWGVGFTACASDAELRGLRHNDRWMAAMEQFPLVAHWIDAEPIDDVAVMAKIEDRFRRYVVDGDPVVTGVVAVGDSWSCTNPSPGRGATIGLMHAVALRDTLRVVPSDDAAAFARAFDDVTVAELEPWYRATLAYDNHRLAEAGALSRGENYDPGDPVWEITRAAQFAASLDPDLMRAFIRLGSLLTTSDEVFAQPGVLDKVISLGSGWRDQPILGPTRDELVKLVNG